MPLGGRDVLFVLRAQDFASREVRNLGSMFGRLGSSITAQRATVDHLSAAYERGIARTREWRRHAGFLQSQQLEVSETLRRQITESGRHNQALAQQVRTQREQLAVMEQQAARAQQHMAVGTALLAAGAAATVAGTAITGFFSSATRSAAEFRHGIALASTQGREFGGTIRELTDIAYDIATTIPIPIEQLAEGLYEIRSSMDVNLREQEHILREVSRAAVAGQTDLQDAMDATITVMNAFNIPAMRVGDVLDWQFRLVELGRGNYGEFAKALSNRLIPTALQAGQSMETVGGIMAFLTRESLNTNYAATSLARAFENITKPKVRERLAEMGVAVEDSHGNFREFTDIITDLGGAMQGMSEVQRSELIESLLAGAGSTIQARRAWNLLLTDLMSGGEQFYSVTGRVGDFQGAMDRAFETMAGEPINQLQLLTNNWRVLRMELGEALFPTLNRLVVIGQTIVRWFRDLSPQTKTFIAIVGTLTGALLTFLGIASLISGMLLVINGALMMVGTSLASVVVTAAPFIAAFIALAAVAYLVYRNWDTIKGFFIDLWDAIKNAVGDAVDWIVNAWRTFTDAASAAFRSIADMVLPYWNTFVDTLQTGWNAIVGAVRVAWTAITGVIQTAWSFIQTVWGYIRIGIDVLVAAFQLYWSYVQFVWNGVVAAIQWAWSMIQPVWNAIMTVLRVMADVFQFLWSVVKVVWDAIAAIIGVAWSIISTIFQMIMNLIIYGLVKAFQFYWEYVKWVWNSFMSLLRTVWNSVISPIFNAIKGAIMSVLAPAFNFIRDVWNRLWDGSVQMLRWAWNSVISPIWDAIKAAVMIGLVATFNVLREVWDRLWRGSVQIIQWAWNSVILPVFNSVRGFIEGTLIPIFNRMRDIWNDVWNSFASTISSVWSSIRGFIASSVNAVLGMVERFVNNIVDGVNRVIRAFNAIPGVADVGTLSRVAFGSVSGGGGGGGRGGAYAMQAGGQLLRDAWTLVGERGPELRYMPRGTGVIPLDRALPGQQDIVKRLDTLIDLMSSREPISVHVTTRDDPWDIGTRSVAIMRAVGG